MGNKYSVVSTGSTTGDVLLPVGNAAKQLSTGDLVMLRYDPGATDPNRVTLELVTAASGHTTRSLIATLSGGASSGNFHVTGVPQCLWLEVDNKDNIFVGGASNSEPDFDEIGVQAWKKGTGLTWTPSTFMHMDTAALEGITGTAFAAVWCNTGGGTSAGGHLAVAMQCNSSPTGVWLLSLNAGAILAGAGSFIVAAQAYNTNIGGLSGVDIDNDGPGATSGLLCYSSGASAGLASQLAVRGWGLTGAGAITAGGGLPATTVNHVAVSPTSCRYRLVRQNAGTWVLILPSATTTGRWSARVFSASAQLTSGPVDDVTGSNFPATSNTLNWDVISDIPGNNKVWLLAWSTATATTMLRKSLDITTPSAPVWGTPVTEDTGVGGTNSTVRAVKHPVDVTHSDWQTYNSGTGGPALVGDFSSLTAPPNAPTLVSPASGSVLQFNTSGGDLDWADSFPVITDSQLAWAVRRQPSGAAYQYWNATTGAWSSTYVINYSAATLLHFAATTTLWIQGTSPPNPYTWAVQIAGQFASGRTDTATVTSGSATVTDASITAADLNRPVSGTGIPANAWVASVGSGTFTIGVPSGSANATANGTSVTLAGLSGWSDEWYITAAFAPPATPSLSAALDSVNNRVTLTVTGTGTDSVLIQYSDDSGSTWNTLRASTLPVPLVLAGGTATVYDPEIPPAGSRQYRVQQWDPTQGIAGTVSAWSTVQTVSGPTYSAAQNIFWLKDILDPTHVTALQVHVKTGTKKRSVTEAQAVHYAIGRSKPVVIAGAQHGNDLTVTFMTFSLSERNTLLSLLETQHALLFQDFLDSTQTYVRRTSATVTELDPNVPVGYFEHAVTFLEVDPPS